MFQGGKKYLVFLLRFQQGNTWGVQLENGTWAGMLGDVAYGKTMTSIAGFGISEARKTVVDFVQFSFTILVT